MFSCSGHLSISGVASIRSVSFAYRAMENGLHARSPAGSSQYPPPAANMCVVAPIDTASPLQQYLFSSLDSRVRSSVATGRLWELEGSKSDSVGVSLAHLGIQE